MELESLAIMDGPNPIKCESLAESAWSRKAIGRVAALFSEEGSVVLANAFSSCLKWFSTRLRTSSVRSD